MGNCFKKPKGSVAPAAAHQHKPKGPTMVSFDFDSAKGQMRSLDELSGLSEPRVPQEEGKRPHGLK